MSLLIIVAEGEGGVVHSELPCTFVQVYHHQPTTHPLHTNAYPIPSLKMVRDMWPTDRTDIGQKGKISSIRQPTNRLPSFA